MRALSVLTAMVALFIVGCAGEAEIKIHNTTDRYIHGDVEGQEFGLPENGQTSRTVEVGGFLKNSSDVTITCYVHCTQSSQSTVVHKLTKTTKVEKNSVYYYNVFFAPDGYYKLAPVAEEPSLPFNVL